jgi:hypothetical protein
MKANNGGGPALNRFRIGGCFQRKSGAGLRLESGNHAGAEFGALGAPVAAADDRGEPRAGGAVESDGAHGGGQCRDGRRAGGDRAHSHYITRKNLMSGRKHIRPFCEISECDAMTAARALDAIYPKLLENEQKMIDRAIENARNGLKLGLQSAKSLVALTLCFMGENGMLENGSPRSTQSCTKEEIVQVLEIKSPACPDCGHEMVSVSGKRLKWKCVNLQCKNRRIYDELFFVTARAETEARASVSV